MSSISRSLAYVVQDGIDINIYRDIYLYRLSGVCVPI